MNKLKILLFNVIVIATTAVLFPKATYASTQFSDPTKVTPGFVERAILYTNKSDSFTITIPLTSDENPSSCSARFTAYPNYENFGTFPGTVTKVAENQYSCTVGNVAEAPITIDPQYSYAVTFYAQDQESHPLVNGWVTMLYIDQTAPASKLSSYIMTTGYTDGEPSAWNIRLDTVIIESDSDYKPGKQCDFYYRKDGGNWALHASQTNPLTNSDFYFDEKGLYEFYVTCQDAFGNKENKPAEPETSVQITDEYFYTEPEPVDEIGDEPRDPVISPEPQDPVIDSEPTTTTTTEDHNDNESTSGSETNNSTEDSASEETENDIVTEESNETANNEQPLENEEESQSDVQNTNDEDVNENFIFWIAIIVIAITTTSGLIIWQKNNIKNLIEKLKKTK